MKESSVKDKRFCYICCSDKTYIDKKGVAAWYHRDGEIFCTKCNNKYFCHPRYHPRRIRFKGKWLSLDHNPRTGVCSKCGRKIGDAFFGARGAVRIMKRTHIHHIEYHEDDPLKDVVELCMSCHITETYRLRRGG